MKAKRTHVNVKLHSRWESGKTNGTYLNGRKWKEICVKKKQLKFKRKYRKRILKIPSKYILDFNKYALLCDKGRIEIKTQVVLPGINLKILLVTKLMYFLQGSVWTEELV